MSFYAEVHWPKERELLYKAGMISVFEAEKIIKMNLAELPSMELPLSELTGRILAEPVFASRNQPSFDRVAMDGIALCYKSLDKTKCFPIESTQKAGEKPHELNNGTSCIEIMTGASLPIGTDTIIPYEKISIEKNTARVLDEFPVKPRQNIHFKALDYGEGNLLINKGEILTSVKVALIASQGIEKVKVSKLPKISILVTGDELIEPGNPIEDWQIYSSNSYGIYSELRGLGELDVVKIVDDRDEIFKAIKEKLSHSDILVLSGGVSAGKFDYVHGLMGDLGIETLFHKVKQRPGKPMLFGKSKNGKLVFGLPGNPVAAMICTRRYLLPAIEQMMGRETLPSKVSIEGTPKLKEGFTFFKGVKDGKFVEGNGSGDFYGLSKTDGFVEVTSIDETYSYYPWGTR